MLNAEEENRKLADFESKHGTCIWKGGWGCAPDGCEVEAASLGFHFIESDTEQRKKQVRIWYWRRRVEELTIEALQLKSELMGKAKLGRATEEEIEPLRQLQKELAEAAKQLDLVENPVGPDPKLVSKARKWMAKLPELVATCDEAEKQYLDAQGAGRETAEAYERWQQAYENWEHANARFQQIPEEARREADRQITDEYYRELAASQKEILNAIEI